MCSDDYLIVLDNNIGALSDYQELNDRKSITVMDREEAQEFFKDEISAFTD